MERKFTLNPYNSVGISEELSFTFSIQPISKKKGLFDMFRKTSHEHNVTFRIVNVKLPTGIDYDSENLLKIKSTTPSIVKYNDGDSPFNVVVKLDFHPEAITSINDTDEFLLCFELAGEDTNGAQVVSEEGKITITLAKPKPNVEAQIMLDDDIFHYETSGRKRIGNLIVIYDSIATPLTKQSNIDFEFLLKLKNEKDEEVQGLLWYENGEYSEGKYITTGIKSKDKDINGYSQPVCVIPLYIDFAKINGLCKSRTQFSVFMQHGRFCCNENKDQKFNLATETEKLYIEKSIIPSTLSVSVKELSDVPYDITGLNCHHLEKRSFTPGSTLVTPIEISITNKASEQIKPYAGVHISSIRISESGTGQLYLRDKSGKQITSIIRYKDDFSEKIRSNGSIFLPDGADGSLIINLEFCPTDIDYIGTNKYDFEVVTTIDIKYWENSDALPMSLLAENEKEKTIMLVWHLHILPHSEWLCVDYGSSAIVCKFDKDLIDLKSKKEEIIRKDTELVKYRKDEIENGTKFLNSDVLLYESSKKQDANESSLCSEQTPNVVLPYSSQAVFLAPTSSLLRDRFLTQIPCLKVLVGNDFLPKDIQYEMFSYYHKDASGNLVKEMARDVQDKANSLLSINSIFKESYHVLFKYFIAGTIGNVENINKLALTYPNTYTPYHRSILKKVVYNVFPHLQKLTFVSESDSVAAYYMNHWKEYHSDIKKLKDPEGERVLVYDMGAGTLDITYFKQKWNSTKCYHKLEIQGKIGTGKAGNYIDFVIATIVCRLAGIDPIIARYDVKGDGDVYSQRVILKQVVKNQIKPKLSNPGNQEIRFTLQNVGGTIYTVNTKDIIEDRAFNDSLDECTYGVIDKFKKYLGKKRPAIDTVIMSGRSCKLVPLQQRLKNAISQNSRTENIEYITLDSPINTKIDSREDRQKTVVVEGAEIIAEEFDSEQSRVKLVSKRIYASYGLSFINKEGDIDYIELLNHQDTDTDCLPGTVFKTEPKEIQVSRNCEVQLVQSYLNEEDTVMYLREGDMEFVSMMESFKTEEFSKSKLSVSLIIDKLDNITLIINNCQSAGLPPKGVDLQNPIIKKSLWPLVFNT